MGMVFALRRSVVLLRGKAQSRRSNVREAGTGTGSLGAQLTEGKKRPHRGGRTCSLELNSHK